MVRLTPPLGWLALAAVWLAIATALVWGWYGSIPTKIKGYGILLREEGVSSLIALGDGQIEEVSIREGDLVEADQVVAYIDMRELKAQRANVQKELDTLSQQYRRLQGVFEGELGKRQITYRAQRANLQAEIGTVRQRQQFLQGRLAAEEKLLAKGLVTEGDVYTTRENLQRAYEDQGKIEISMEKIETEELELQTSRERELFDQNLRILETQNKLQLLDEQIGRRSVVRSLHAGRIIQVMVRPGVEVVTGGTIANVERKEGPLQAVVYIPPGKGGHLIKPGMVAQVVPSTVKRDEYGYMPAKVSYISSYNASEAMMRTVLGNEELVKLFSREGPPIQLFATVAVDHATKSGLKWSTGKGPPYSVSVGVGLEAEVVVREQPPITLLIPLLKGWFGLA